MGAFIELLIRVSNINEVVSSYPEPFEVFFIEDLQKHLNLNILNTKKGYWTELPVWSEEKQMRVLQKQYFENYEISFEKDMKRKVLIGVSQDTGYFHIFMNTLPVVGKNEKSMYLFHASFYFLAKKVLTLGGQNVTLFEDSTEMVIEKEDDIETFYKQIDLGSISPNLVHYLNAPHNIAKHRPGFPKEWIIKSKYWLAHNT